MLNTSFQIIFLFLFPAFLVWITKKSRVLGWLGPIVLCYATGLFIANTPGIHINENLSENTLKITIPLAIILLLLNTHFIKCLHLTGKALYSFLLCIISVTISTLAAGYFFSEYTPESASIAGMLIGVYTGGTPNMSAIGFSLNVSEEKFILLNAADLALGGVYLLLLMTLIHPMLKKFLPAFVKSKAGDSDEEVTTIPDYQLSYTSVLKKYLAPIGIAVLILGASAGISLLVTGKLSEVIVILSVSTIAIIFSFSRKIRALNGSFVAGEYFLMVFCIAVGSLADFQQLISTSGFIFFYVSVVMVSSIILHFILAAILRIDADTVMITSTAAIYGPAFVPIIARVMKNENIIVSGITTGLVGYAIANYLGIAIAYIIQ